MMDELVDYLRRHRVLDKSPREALLLVADHALAREITITPDALKQALCTALPECGEALFDLLGVRVPYSLAALCYLALYDQWLCYAMSLTLETLLTNHKSVV
jgi:hypothetical protein